MKRQVVVLTCVIGLLLTASGAVSSDGTSRGTATLEASASSAQFELPDNLPYVEAVVPLDAAAKARLRANGFVVLPDQGIDRLSNAYMRLFSEHRVSVLITTDVALHLFHNVFDDLLAEVEKAHLLADVRQLVQDLYALCTAQYAMIPDTQPLGHAAARHNILVLSVASRLLDETFVPPDYVEPAASRFVQKVLEHSASEVYPGDDYTQYEPRGHYAGHPDLESYFRSVKWLSRRIFRIEDRYYPAEADVELTAAALLSQAIVANASVRVLWERIYDVTRQLAGPADSITPLQVHQALENVFGPAFSILMLEDANNRAALRSEFERDVYPVSEIIPVITEFPDQIPLKYIQLLGERYLPDAAAMQQTTFPHVPSRFLPSGLDVIATVLSSGRAEHWLAAEIVAYPALADQLRTLRADFDAYDEDAWQKSVYNGWLYSLRPLCQPMPSGAPLFMQGQAWQDKELNSALASWTQLRHDFILYGKQTYVPAPWAWGPGLVEPVPDTFGRLASLCDQSRDVLSLHQMLPQQHASSLQDLATQLRLWERYASKVANGGWLDDEEQDNIHRVGIWLLGFFQDGYGVAEKSPQLVADVASDSLSARVLHEGTGPFNPMVVIYTPPEGEAIAGIGYIFSHYEFVEPHWNRLNDAEWESRLADDPPARPPWASSFLPQQTLHLFYFPWVRNDR
jgi:hypothetical protein